MPLINCPECKKEVSDSATACPYCGFPVKKTFSHNKIVNFFKKTGTATSQKIKSNIVMNDKLKDFLFLLLIILGGIVGFVVVGAILVLLLALAHTYEIVGIILFIILLVGSPIVAYFESYVWGSKNSRMRKWWYFPLSLIVSIIGAFLFIGFF